MERSRCACGLSTEGQIGIHKLVDLVPTLGGGNFDLGVEVIRENHKWSAWVRAKSEKIGMHVILTGITIIIAAASAIFALGFYIKAKIGG